MLKTLLSNPVTRTFVALILAIIAVLGAFFTYVTAPGDFGNANIRFDTDAIYYFADNWSMAYDYAQIDFSPGTLVIPGYNEGQVVAVLLIPPEAHPGTVRLSFPKEYREGLPTVIEDNLDQVLILLDYADYARIIQDSGNTILLRADDVDQGDVPHHYLKHQFDNGYSLLTSYNIFGYTNCLLPTPETVLLRIWGQRLGALTYYEDIRVKVTTPDFTLDFPHPELEEQYYPPTGYQARVLVYMFFLSLTAIGLISFISGGLEAKGKEIEGQYNGLQITAVLLGALLYTAGLSAFNHLFQPSQYAIAALWALPTVGVALWAIKARLTPDFFGISFHGLAAGLVAAVMVSALFALGSTFNLPRGVLFDISTLLPLGLVIVLRETLLRGFCQRTLSHWLHPWVGLVVVSCAWAIIELFFAGAAPLGVLDWASALGKSLTVGYLYQRTQNIFAPCLLATLLELAPMFLRF